MAFNYNTPGVYLEEIVKLPPSVASVQTAIPCFFGKTEKATEVVVNDLKGVSKKINSLAEYEAFFGIQDKAEAVVTIELNMPSVATLSEDYSKKNNNMYYGIKHYFDNGGGPCYVHSVGDYSENVDGNLYKNEILKLDLVDEVTLVVFPDLAGIEKIKAYDVYNSAMQKIAALKDKFIIIDVFQEMTGSKIDLTKSKAVFRNNISNNTDQIKYGAAYFPFVQTTYQYNFDTASIKMTFSAEVTAKSKSCALLNGLDYGIAKNLFKLNNVLSLFNDDYFKNIGVDAFENKVSEINGKVESIKEYFTSTEQQTLIEKRNKLTDAIIAQGTAATEVVPAKTKFDFDDAAKEKSNFLKILQDKAIALYSSFKVNVEGVDKTDFDKFNTTFLSKITPFFNSAFEAKLKEAFLNIPLFLPPSPSIAGVYASVDRDRGVWKAPANVSLSSVSKPAVPLSDLDQGDFNVDPENGKSINCIRQFTGRGNLVWGARTLAGNNNEWKYVNVRRFFNMVEESCENAARQFVFEPNDANTWVRVKGMIENYLTNLWRAGALQGAKPEHAFYVSVGLNQTMTQDDILNGLLIVEVGLAVVRPAEFIILRFSHKLALS